MKQILIEHSGSSYHTKVARKIGDLLEHISDCEVEQIVGVEKDKVTLYNESNMAEIGSFSAVPQKQTLQLYLSLMT